MLPPAAQAVCASAHVVPELGSCKDRRICAGDAAVAALKETQHNLSMDRRDVSLLEVARDYCDNGAVK